MTPRRVASAGAADNGSEYGARGGAMTRRFGGLVIVAIVVAALALAADAGAQGVYLGGAYSWATVGIDKHAADVIDDSANAYKLFLGYEFPEFLGIELGYTDFGSYKVGELGASTSQAGELTSNGWTGALTGRIPLGRPLTIYGKIGYFYWDAKVKAAHNIGELADSGGDRFWGAGLRINLGKVSILGEFERFDSEKITNDLLSLGLRFTF
jgi:OmpA-OmpF porin, OOP family